VIVAGADVALETADIALVADATTGGPPYASRSIPSMRRRRGPGIERFGAEDRHTAVTHTTFGW
jgi:hypothetical protein